MPRLWSGCWYVTYHHLPYPAEEGIASPTPCPATSQPPTTIMTHITHDPTTDGMTSLPQEARAKTSQRVCPCVCRLRQPFPWDCLWSSRTWSTTKVEEMLDQVSVAPLVPPVPSLQSPYQASLSHLLYQSPALAGPFQLPYSSIHLTALHGCT